MNRSFISTGRDVFYYQGQDSFWMREEDREELMKRIEDRKQQEIETFLVEKGYKDDL